MQLIKNKAIWQSGRPVCSSDGRKEGTIAWRILHSHNSGSDTQLRIKFDSLISHDITYVGIIQTAKASGLTRFPVPYVMTNCHNSLCAVGGTINEDDHVFGLCASQSGGDPSVRPGNDDGLRPDDPRI